MYHVKAFGQLIGVSPETIRHYERIGILPEAKRSDNGYRVYSDFDAERLLFVGRARQLDISLDDIAQIIALRDMDSSPCGFVSKVLSAKVTEIDRRIQELEALRAELVTLQKVSTKHLEKSSSACICQIIETDTIT